MSGLGGFWRFGGLDSFSTGGWGEVVLYSEERGGKELRGRTGDGYQLSVSRVYLRIWGPKA
jgi:hypothetical protein